MGSRDERIVEMKFDNAQFEKGVAQTRKSLKDLDDSLQLTDGTKAFSGISSAARSVDLSSIASGVEALQKRFSLFGIMGMKVMEEVAEAAIRITKNIWNATFGQIKSGGIRRAMNIENAHFMLQGLLKDEKEVTRIMKLAGDSVDGTAYSYDEAAKAASMFAASGIKDTKQLEQSLRAITGVAAMTNSEYEGISMIFTTVAGNGRLMGDQLLQLSSRGMNAASTITEYMNGVNNGTKKASESLTAYIKEITGGTQKTESDIREMVSKSKISFELFSAAMDDAFGEHAKKANETFTGALSNVKAALSRTGEKFVAPLIEQNGTLVKMLNSLRVMINKINKEIPAFADTFVGAVTSVSDKLRYFFNNLNVTDLFKGLAEILRIVTQVLSPIGAAFRKAFIVTDSMKMSENTISRINLAIIHFRQNLEKVKPSEKTLKDLENTFGGLFAVVKMGVNLITSFVRVFLPFGEKLGDARRSILNFTGSVGEWLMNLEKTLKESDAFTIAFTKVKDAIVKVSEVVQTAFKAILDYTEPFRTKIYDIFTGLVDKLKNIDFSDSFSGLKGIFSKDLSSSTIGESTTALDALLKVLSKIKDVFVLVKNGIVDFVKKLGSVIDTTTLTTTIVSAFKFVLDGIVEAIKWIVDLLAQFGSGIKGSLWDVITNLDFEKLTDLLTTGGFIVLVKKLGETLGGFTDAVNAEELKTIADAVGILALAIGGLTLIDSGKLKTSVEVIGALFAELSVAYAFISRFTKASGESKDKTGKTGGILGVITSIKNISGALENISKSMAIKAIKEFAEAILILAGALLIISTIDMEDMTKALLGITILVIEMSVVTKKLSDLDTKGLKGIGGTFVSFALSIIILSSALKTIAELDTNSMLRGLLGLGLVMVEMKSFIKSSNDVSKLSVGNGLGLIGMATAMVILGKAFEKIGGLDYSTIAKGLAGIGGAMLIMATALKKMPDADEFTKFSTGFKTKSATPYIKISVAMIAMAGAMEIFADVIERLGKLGLEKTAVGLVGIGGALTAVVLAFKTLKTKDIKDSAIAFNLMGTAMLIMASAIEKVGGLDIKQVAIALGALAGSLAAVVVSLKWLSGGKAKMLKTEDVFFTKERGSIKEAAEAIAIVAASLGLLTIYIEALGRMKPENVAVGVGALAISLGVLVIALNNVKGTTGGATALLLAAAALDALVPAIVILSALDPLKVALALVEMSVAIIAMGLAGSTAGAALAPYTNVLTKAAAALALFGVACAAVGVGVAAVSAGIIALVAAIGSVPATIAAIIALVSGVIIAIADALAASIAIILVGLAKGLAELVKWLAAHQQEILSAIFTIFEAIISLAVGVFAGGIYLIFEVLATTLDAIAESQVMGRIIDSFLRICIQISDGIKEHIGELTDSLIGVLLELSSSIRENAQPILDEAIRLVVDLLEAAAKALADNSEKIIGAVKDIFLAIGILLVELLKTVIEALPGGEMLTGKLSELQDKMRESLNNDEAYSEAQLFGQAIEDGLSSKISGIQQKAELIQKALAVASPSELIEAQSRANYLYGSTDADGLKDYNTAKIISAYHPDETKVSDHREVYIEPEKGSKGNIRERFNNSAFGQKLGQQFGITQSSGSHSFPIEMGDIEGNAEKQGNRYISGVSKGVSSSLPEVQKAGEQTGKTMYTGVSKYTYPIGQEGTTQVEFYNNNFKNGAAQANKSGSAVSQSLLSGLEKYGIKIPGKGTEYVKNYASNFLSGKSGVVSSTDNVVGAQITTLKKYAPQFDSAGDTNISEYYKSILEGKEPTSSASGGVGQAGVLPLLRTAPEFSNAGVSSVGLYSGAILAGKAAAGEAGSAVGGTGAGGANSQRQEYAIAGQNAIQGFAAGILSQMAAAQAAAAAVALNALRSIKNALGISSPSKEFAKVGGWSGEGFVIGLKKCGTAIEDESVALANDSINAMTEGLQKVKQIADNNMNYEPEIRPVFNLTDIQSGMNTLDGIVSNNSALAAATSFNISAKQDDVWGRMLDANAQHEENLKKIIDSQTMVLREIRASIANQQIILDSGELVGATIEKIDDALGNRMTYRERGN